MTNNKILHSKRKPICFCIGRRNVMLRFEANKQKQQSARKHVLYYSVMFVVLIFVIERTASRNTVEVDSVEVEVMVHNDAQADRWRT